MKFIFRLFLFLTCVMWAGSASGANYFWIGGSGNWANLSHWSATSGGTAFYTVAPGPNDDVFIDNNSGLSAGDSVHLSSNISCHDFTIDSLPFKLRFTYFSLFTIYGDISIASPTEFQYARIELEPLSLTTNIFAPYTNFYDVRVPVSNYSINLLSKFQVNYNFDISYSNTTLNSNNHDLYLADVTIGYTTQLNLGTSAVYFVDGQATWQDNGRHNLPNTSFFLLGSAVTFSESFRAKNVFIDNLSDATFNDTVHLSELTCMGYLYLQDVAPTPDTIHKLVMHNGTFFTNLVTDTIIYNIPPNASLALVFDELTINDYFEVNGTPGSDIFMAQAGTGAFALLYMNMPVACLDFLTISDINIIGTGMYYAGANSNGSGNNWIWSGCSPTYSNVWPGDANDDLMVDQKDFLYVGLGNQYTGTPRDSISNYFAANTALNWYSFFPNGLNFKYADCNGDSTINADDTLAIVQNYGLSHPAFSPANNPLPLALTATNLTLGLPGLLTPGMSYFIPIIIGDSILNNLDIHGLAFSLFYDTAFIDPSTVDIQFGSSWFALPGESINFKRNFPQSGKIDFAMTRFDGTDATGGGRIAWLIFTVKNNVAGNAVFQFAEKLAVNSNMEELFILSGTLPIGTTVGLDEFLSGSGDGVLSPNPAKDKIVLTLADPTPIIAIEIFNVNGGRVLTENLSSGTNRVEIDIRSLPSGIYFLRAQRHDFTTVDKKFIVQ